MEANIKAHGHVKLNFEQFLIVVQQWKDGEWDLFMAIKDWLDVDYKNRKQHLDSPMSHVRFSLLTPAQLEAVKQMKIYSDGSWKLNVQLGEDIHSRPVHNKMMRPTSVRSKPRPVCFSDDKASSIFTLEEDGKWTDINVEGMPSLQGPDISVLEFNNFLIVGGFDSFDAFDVSTLTWSKMQDMKIPRGFFSLVHDGHYIYVSGGIIRIRRGEARLSDDIERYDPGTNTWTVMSTKLPTPVYCPSACVCSGPYFSIYVSGGYEKIRHEDQYSLEMHSFNPYEEPATLHRKAPLLWDGDSYFMQEMAFAAVDPAILAMCHDLAFQYYDLRTDQWSKTNVRAFIAKDLWWQREGTVLSDHSENTLYILNIKEQFPFTMREPEEGVCLKWPLNKLNKDIYDFPEEQDKSFDGCSMGRFPIQGTYFAAMLALPKLSKRKIKVAAAAASGSKTSARTPAQQEALKKLQLECQALQLIGAMYTD